ncbi:HepT-like ribonuclease domain-containing protein [Rhodoplanes roseus]|nr:HepT-like ribonuclease domain-containing protein [Rhodoplanes roseus]
MKDVLIPLHDILSEIEFLHSIRDRSTFEQFKASSSDLRAAAYSVMVISEAVRRIPEDWLAEYPATPWHAIRSIGNKLRHEYQRVSEAILWGIIADSAVELEVTLRDMLGKRART